LEWLQLTWALFSVINSGITMICIVLIVSLIYTLAHGLHTQS